MHLTLTYRYGPRITLLWAGPLALAAAASTSFVTAAVLALRSPL